MSLRWTKVVKMYSPYLFCLLMSVFTFPAWATTTGSKFNMPPGVTPVSENLYSLHMTILWICAAIGVVVYGVMLYAMFFHRQSRGTVPAKFHESTTVEIIWTIIPFIILLVMAVPATRTLVKMYDTRDADVTVKITGYRWYWEYEYPDEDIQFFSYLSTPEDQINNIAPKGEYYLLEVDKPLVIPVGKKVRFLVTSKDVIHSWWVPDFGLKRDAIPGFIHESWTYVEPDKIGTYRGQCAELCGVKHGYMPIVVEAVSEADYQNWLQQQKKK